MPSQINSNQPHKKPLEPASDEAAREREPRGGQSYDSLVLPKAERPRRDAQSVIDSTPIPEDLSPRRIYKAMELFSRELQETKSKFPRLSASSRLERMTQCAQLSEEGNVLVYGSNAELAKKIAGEAEILLPYLTERWLGPGAKIPKFEKPLIIAAELGTDADASGKTFFNSSRHGNRLGEIAGCYMLGTEKDMLGSVLPHELMHVVLGTHLKSEIPRWADEGMACLEEAPYEQDGYFNRLFTYLRTNRGIAFRDMFSMNNYPKDYHPLYSQGYAVVDYLVRRGKLIEEDEARTGADNIKLTGRERFVRFLEEGLNTGNWEAATKNYYDFPTLGALQDSWVRWIERSEEAARNSR